jgi:hypothetical protein
MLSHWVLEYGCKKRNQVRSAAFVLIVTSDVSILDRGAGGQVQVPTDDRDGETQ